MTTLESEVAEAAGQFVEEDKVEHAGRLLTTFNEWNKIRDYAKSERKRTKELVDGRLQQFTEAIEVGHRNEQEQVLKLTVCEVRWQELSEARVGRKEILGALRDQLKGVEQKIKDLIEEASSNQLPLFSSSTSTVDSPPRAEEDEEEDPAEEGLDVEG